MNIQKKFLQHMDSLSRELVNQTQELIQRNSENPQGDERAVSELVASEFNKLGLQVARIEAQPQRINTIGILKGTGEGRSLLYARVDSKPPARLRDDRTWMETLFDSCLPNIRGICVKLQLEEN